MDTLDIITIIGQAITFIGVIFVIWKNIKEPQFKADKIDALLSQKVEYTNKINDSRFIEVQKDIKVAFELAQNHSNEALAGVRELTCVTNDLSKQVVKLQTIIEERLPRK